MLTLEAADAADRWARSVTSAPVPLFMALRAAGSGDAEQRPAIRGGSPDMRLKLAQAHVENARLQKAASDAHYALVQANFTESVKFIDILEKEIEVANDIARTQREAIEDLNKATQERFEKNQELIVKQTDKELAAHQALIDGRKLQERELQRLQIDGIKSVIEQTIQFWMLGSKRTAATFLESMLAAFANRALQNAIENLFANIRPGGKGSGFLGFLGGLLGFQHGGEFKVGGSGGADSQLVAFRATPGERVTIAPEGSGGGGVTYAPVTHIDARGATPDLIKALPKILDERDRRNAEALENRIVTKLRKGAYDRG
jgi:hypothetical protein